MSSATVLPSALIFAVATLACRAGDPGQDDAPVPPGGEVFTPVASCAPALGPAVPSVRTSSLRAGNCDYGEVLHQRCQRSCAEDGRCAPGETCQVVEDVTDFLPPPRGAVCTCAGDSCPERSPGAMPREPEGGLGLWAAQPPLPTDLHDHAAAASNDWLFVGGGLRYEQLLPNGATNESVKTVFSARLGPDGAVMGWSSAGELPGPRSASAMVVHAGRLYLLGGREEREYTSSVWSAPISADGTLGAWREESPMPGTRGKHRALLVGDRLVVAGGDLNSGSHGGTWDIWLGTFDEQGHLGAWRKRVAPKNTYHDGGAGVALGRLYLLGTDGVLRSARVPALDDWRDEARWPSVRQFTFKAPSQQTDVNMGPVQLWELCGALVALVGDGNALTAPLDAGGRVGSWRIASRFYGPRNQYASAATTETLYAVAGSNGATPLLRLDTVWSVRRR